MRPSAIEARVRAICLALPEATERESHGAPAFFAGKQFVMLWINGHHDHHFAHLWCAAPPGAQEGLVAMDPDRFFRPPYVGSRGWIGRRLDGRWDQSEIEALCEDAYCAVASKRLIARFEEQSARDFVPPPRRVGIRRMAGGGDRGRARTNRSPAEPA